MSFLEAIESIRGLWIRGFIRMYEERFLPVRFHYVRFRHTRLEVKDGVGVEAESLDNSYI